MFLSLRSRTRLLLSLITLVTVIGGCLAVAAITPASARAAPAASSTHVFVNCVTTRLCADVAESEEAFGQYVGHDEPSNLFYSNIPGSGNHMRWLLRLPKDPPVEQNGMPKSSNQSFNFQLHP